MRYPARRLFLKMVVIGIAASVILTGCRESAGSDPFSGAQALLWVTKQCDLGPRITGTEANLKAGDMILETLEDLGWSTREQLFPYQGVQVRNLLAWKGEGPAVLLGAHYDSRRSADREDPSQPVPGANDGASGVAVLLELARVLDWARVDRTVYLAFFDAEDNGELDGWEWIVGSTYMAAHWGEEGEPDLDAMVLVDMIGDADQQIYYERNSDPALSAELWSIADGLGYGNRIIPRPKYAMIDDHIPFARLGVPAADMIDFDYAYFHTTQDTPDKVSAESLEAVGRTLEVWLEGRETE